VEAVGREMKRAMGMPMRPKQKQIPAQTMAERRAQLRSKKSPIAVTMPKMEQAIATAIVAMPTVFANAGCSGRVAGNFTSRRVKRPIPVPASTSKLPRMAITPAAIMEAVGLERVPIGSVYIISRRAAIEK
jgi:hypothetical protein